jgi:hypothetical protein
MMEDGRVVSEFYGARESSRSRLDNPHNTRFFIKNHEDYH